MIANHHHYLRSENLLESVLPIDVLLEFELFPEQRHLGLASSNSFSSLRCDYGLGMKGNNQQQQQTATELWLQIGLSTYNR